MFDKETLEIIKRLQNARITLMRTQPFYAVLLIHMQFAVDPECDTAYTDGKRIVFGTDFIKRISDKELQFVLMHEVLHVALDHCGRTKTNYDYFLFNVACDIVVNSNIMHSFDDDVNSISLDGEPSMHTIDDNNVSRQEGWKLTAEEVYEKLLAQKEQQDSNGNSNMPGGAGDSKGDEGENCDLPGFNDDHSYWDGYDESNSDNKEGDSDGDGKGDGKGDSKDGANSEQGSGYNEHSWRGEDSNADARSEERQTWLNRMIEATQIARQISIRYGSKDCGSIPAGAARILNELTEPQTDWKTVLDNFIQEEINDYSFDPSDRRMQDSPFLLPDFNETDESVKDILFMVDTSGSMSDQMIKECYSEIKGAIDQFNGKLSGWLGFFDAVAVEPKPFTDENEFKIIRPEGGGGTSFHCVFEYVEKKMIPEDKIPVSIVILTDGCAPFPNEKEANDIPVLWIINNEEITPPWGKVTRIKTKENYAV